MYGPLGIVAKFVSSIKRINPLSANTTDWSDTLKQFVGNLPTSCLSVFDHFVKLALKVLRRINTSRPVYLRK